MEVSHAIVQIRTTNLEESIHFYTQQLGFELDFQYQDFYAGLKVANDQFIHLKLVYDRDPSIDYVQGGGHQHLFFAVADANAAAKQVKSAGVKFHSELMTTPRGSKEFYVLDNQGHTLCFSQEAETSNA